MAEEGLNAFCMKETGSIRLMKDNQASIALASNESTKQGTKHLDIKYHFCRWAGAGGARNSGVLPQRRDGRGHADQGGRKGYSRATPGFDADSRI